ncbi:MAG: hypothetical protein ACFBSE_17630 [Prochloraceae cyanobacterium]
MGNPIGIFISKRRLKLIPDIAEHSSNNRTKENEFDVLVTNNSNEFASFQVEIEAIGVESNSDSNQKWYKVDPELCTKKPPGDETKFHVVINKPPLPAYETVINLKLTVFSIEFPDLYVEERLSLTVDKPRRSLRVYLPAKELKTFPGELIQIPVLIYNLSQKATTVILSISGLETGWIEKDRLDVEIEPGDSIEQYFICQPPEHIKILSKTYQFAIEAKSVSSGYTPPIQKGNIEILPYGIVELNCPEEVQTIPVKKRKKLEPKQKEASYELEFKNNSNLSQQIELEIHEQDREKCTIELPEPIEIDPGEKDSVYLKAKKSRPWLGGGKRIFFKVFPVLSHPESEEEELNERVSTRPNVQSLELVVKPVIPVPLQYAGGILGLLLIWLAWFLNPVGHHQGSVNSIRIIGNGGTVVSGGSDRTIRRWQVNSSRWLFFSRRLKFEGLIAEDTNKPVRVIRQSKKDDDVIAAGLDNGNIYLWNILSKNRKSVYQGNDRVFDLDFTRDARYLFSVHGSGFVYQWDLNDRNGNPTNRAYPKFALSTIAISEGQNKSTLIFVAGRYGKLAVWDWQAEKFYEFKYKLSTENEFEQLLGQNHYIDSLAIANDKNILAMADNQGYITLWDLNEIRQCIDNYDRAGGSLKNVTPNGQINFKKILNCDSAILDRWREGHNSEPIHSLALTQDGCYLVSTGDDGKVMLWPLNKEGLRSSNLLEGKTIAEFSDTILKTNDIKAISNYLLIASEANNDRIILYRIKRMDINAECYQ